MVSKTAIANAVPTAKGAVSSLYDPVALQWNGGPHLPLSLNMKLCICISRKYSRAIWPDWSPESKGANITTVCSLSQTYDLPTGVGKYIGVCEGEVSLTSKPGRSGCSNSGLDEEYVNSKRLMYQPSPPDDWKKWMKQKWYFPIKNLNYYYN